jgi:purine-binding chemotaxis protein CheW
MSNVTPLRPSSFSGADRADYLTFAVGDQNFAVRAVEARDVLRRQTLTPIPLAPRQIAGLMNLRGHIVTAVDLRAVLDRAAVEDSAEMSIVVDYHGEPYCLIVDQVGEVVTVDAAEVEPNPGSMRQSLAILSRGVVKMRDGLVVMLDLNSLFGSNQTWAA